tara:strand:- start:380 stop:490 length:111 start_codon:yes stop_codon:yes gene_type:complete
MGTLKKKYKPKQENVTKLTRYLKREYNKKIKIYKYV